MKKTLLICGRYPLPEDHGSPIRTMNFVRFFKKYGRVDVVYSSPSAGECDGSGIFKNAYLLKQNEAMPAAFTERVNRLSRLPRLPLPIKAFDREAEELLLSIIAKEDYDYILVRYVVNSSIVSKLPKKYRQRTIIDFDDVLSGSLYDSMYGAVGGWHKKMIVSLNRNLLRNYEMRCLHSGASLFCSDNDRAQFAGENGKAIIYVVPNIYVNVTFEDFDFGEGFDNGNTLLFVGALGYGPNRQSLRWFIERIFPYFRERYTDARLLVVGRTPDDETRRLCENSICVELHADVPDIREYYQRCRAVVVPLLAGGGTRIKILEAAMASRPVLSTGIGAEGLDLENERDILLFEGAEDFISQYAKLDDGEKYNSLVCNAKEFLLTKYSVQRFNGIMDEVLDEMKRRTEAKNGHKQLMDRNLQL